MNELIERLEANIREAIDKTPGIMDVSEAEYCEAVASALAVIKHGVEMRAQELNDEE